MPIEFDSGMWGVATACLVLAAYLVWRNRRYAKRTNHSGRKELVRSAATLLGVIVITQAVTYGVTALPDSGTASSQEIAAKLGMTDGRAYPIVTSYDTAPDDTIVVHGVSTRTVQTDARTVRRFKVLSVSFKHDGQMQSFTIPVDNDQKFEAPEASATVMPTLAFHFSTDQEHYYAPLVEMKRGLCQVILYDGFTVCRRAVVSRILKDPSENGFSLQEVVDRGLLKATLIDTPIRQLRLGL